MMADRGLINGPCARLQFYEIMISTRLRRAYTSFYAIKSALEDLQKRVNGPKMVIMH